MSGISSVGSGSSSLYPLITSNPDPTDTVGTDATDSNSTASQDISSTSGSLTTSPLGDLRDQIETAVTNAVSQLPAGSSPQDIFSAVKGAVQDTLKANGLDPKNITGQHHGHHHHAHAAGGGGGADGGNDGDADDQSGNKNPLTAPGTTSADALVTLLQQITGNNSQNPTPSGSADPTSLITPSNTATQTSSLLSALQNNNSGGVNLTNIFVQLFQGFPSGTGLDVRA